MRWLRISSLLALAACGGARAVPPKAEDPPAAPVTTAESPKAKDWLWEVVGGTQTIYWRRGEGGCERWRLSPEGGIADFKGTLSAEREDAGPPVSAVRFHYDGNPPKISQPTLGGEKLPCDENATGEWFLSKDACLDQKATANIAPSGCLGWASPAAVDDHRAAAMAKIAATKTALDELRLRLEHATTFWIGKSCEPRWVRHRTPKSGRIVSIIEGADDLYPRHVRWKDTTFELAEEAETNPHLRPRERIGIGCCTSTSATPLESAQERVVVKVGTETQVWWFDLAACRGG